MKKNLLYGGLLLIFTATFCGATPSSTKHIIFDGNGVLFKEDKTSFARKIGISALTCYTLSHFKNPVDTCVKTLHYLYLQEGNSTISPFTFMNKQMPRFLVEWHEGKISGSESLVCIKKHLEELKSKSYFASSQEAELVTKILELVFDPVHFSDIAKPDEHVFELIKTLKSRGHRIYLLTNMTHEIYESIKKAFPHQFSLFDGICLSCEHGLLKPSPSLFEAFLKKHALEPSSCIFIDDEAEHAKTAASIGFEAIVHTNARRLKTALAKRGIL